MATLKDALKLIEAGDWQTAHTIVQSNSSQIASWAHGIVHLMEGDRTNAGYWYRRAEREFPMDMDIASEIVALREKIASK